jgi:hypothetical protein
MEPSAWGYNWATLFFGGCKYGDLALQVGGVSKIGTIMYGLESRETRTREGLRWRGPAATVITGQSSRQRGRYKITNPQLSKENFKEKEKLVTSSDGGLTPEQTDQLTFSRKITLTLTHVS